MTPAEDLAASTSPPALAASPGFWLAHGWLVALAAAGLLGAWPVLSLVLPAAEPPAGPLAARAALVNRLNVVFAVVQVAVVVLAAGAGVVALARLAINRAVARAVDEAAQKRRDALVSGEAERPRIDELSALLPPWASAVPPAVARMCLRILAEARGRRLDSLNHIVEPFQEETFGDLAALERAQRTSLRLGILGTFIGLLLGLQAIPELVGDTAASAGLSVDQRFASLALHLLSSLELAFGTSVTGLCAALWIAGLAGIYKSRQERYFRELETTALQMLTLAGEAENPDLLLSGLDQAATAVTEVRHQVYDHAKKVEASLERVGSQVDGQTEAIREGMARLATLRQEFDGFLAEVSRSQGRFLGELEQVYDLASLKRLFDKLEGSLGEVADNVTTRLEVMRGLAGGIAERCAAIERATSEIEGKVAQAAERSQGFLGRLEPGLGKLESTLSQVERLGLVGLQSAFFRTLFFATLLGIAAGVAVAPKNALGAAVGALLGPGLALAWRWRGTA